MNKLAKISCVFILLWGIYPISSFNLNIYEVDECRKIFNLNIDNYDLKTMLAISVYSELFLSILFVFDIITKIKKK